jgi:starch-binding outer membrane protein, SusD/RagB family
MKRIIFIGLLIICCTSCKKFLYQEPYNSVSVNDIFKDFEGARTTLVGCYDDLKATDYYMRTFSIYPEVTGGNIKYTRSANLALQNSYNFANDINENDMKGFYANAYNIIYKANSLIENINKATDATNQQKNRLLADAYSIRAFVHFDLVRVFSQSLGFSTNGDHPAIIIRNFNVSTLTPNGPRNTCKEVYNSISADIDSAITLYAQATQIFTLGDAKFYFSLDAAKALKARISLYKNDWNDVITQCSDLIASNKYPLITNANYVNSWAGQTVSTESIFELGYGNRTGGSLGDYYNVSSSNNTWQLGTTNDLLSLFTTGDVRGQNNMFLLRTVSGVPFYSTNKYQGISGTTLGNNIKILRASELFLSRAEAYAETNNLTAALADLNRIRQRANPTALAFTSTDKQIILDEIFAERRRELCFEGHLFFDISRRKRNLQRVDCTATTCSFNYPDARFATVIPIFN